MEPMPASLTSTLFRPSNSYSLLTGLDDLVGVVVVTDDHILIHTDGTVVYLTDTDTSYIFIIIDGTDQYLGSCLGVDLRERECS